ADLLSDACGACSGGFRRASGVRQEVFLDLVAVGLEQHVGAAQLADLLLGPLDHAVALAALGIEHLAGARDLEALFGAGFGLQLGHFALLLARERSRKARFTGICSKSSFVLRHRPPPRQPLISRAAEGRGYGRANPK